MSFPFCSTTGSDKNMRYPLGVTTGSSTRGSTLGLCSRFLTGSHRCVGVSSTCGGAHRSIEPLEPPASLGQLPSNAQELRSWHVVRNFHGICFQRSCFARRFKHPFLGFDHLEPKAKSLAEHISSSNDWIRGNARRERQIFLRNSAISVSRFEIVCSASRSCSCCLRNLTSAPTTRC